MFRKILFWAHLGAGLVAGVVVAIMCFTGAALTFEKDIVTWAERDARRIERPPSGTARLSPDDLVRRALAFRPEARIQNITVSADDADAVTLALPNNVVLAVNPYTGEVKEVRAPQTRAFMQEMRGWHTRLNFKAGPGNAGAAINGAANVLFVFLGVSGLILWWPRAWSLRVLRPSIWFVRARGKARDWNWHNVIGLWTLPLVLVLAGTGVVMSYRWANELVFKLAGDQPPQNLIPPALPPLKVGPPPANTTLLPPERLLAAAQKNYPEWVQATLRFNPPRTAQNVAAPPVQRTAVVVVKDAHPWPRFDTNTLTLDAYTGDVLRTEGYATLPPGLQARRWVRLLHSGEAFGKFIQFLSGLACVGGCVLVYTGFALAWRRFFGRKPATAT